LGRCGSDKTDGVVSAKKRLVVAVSGGVDSVALLDMLAKANTHELVVAHFDHGIREDSGEDAAFVAKLASTYNVRFETKREELGKGASEELARSRRYAFLREVAGKHQATIVTAHHAGDIVETVAINLTRGTGWRGLAVLDSDVFRPLLHLTKTDITTYAADHNLSWHEDSTNSSDAYLRNRIRRKTKSLTDDQTLQILALRAEQVGIKHRIDDEVKQLVGDGPEYSRYFFSHVDPVAARECLRYITRGALTRPQLGRALIAIKTAKAGSIFEAGSGVRFRFTSRNFSIELIK